jgi:hypothetical protein
MSFSSLTALPTGDDDNSGASVN